MAVAGAALLAAASITSPSFWWGVAVGMVLALAIAVAWVVHSRRQNRVLEAHLTARQTRTEVDATPVRRPIYLDRGLLNDLLAHAEPRDFGKGLRATLADADLHGSAGDTRLLNKVIAGLRRQRHLIDLDVDPEAPLASGRAVLVTARVEEHDATRRHASMTPSGSGTELARDGALSGVATRERERVRRRSEPIVLRCTVEGTDRSYAGVIDARRLRRVDGAWMTTPVTVLAVVDEVLATGQRASAATLLGTHLGEELHDDLGTFGGPGALVSVAAIYR